jgi:hypothetical protein
VGRAMKKYLAWLHGLPLIVYLGLGLFAYTKWTQWQAAHRAEDERFLAQTIVAFKEINDENERVRRLLVDAQKKAAKAQAEANRERERQQEILDEHPIATAPASCAPWTQALLSCQREAQDLRTANAILNASLDSARSHTEKIDTTLKRGEEALDKTRCKFPCIDIVVGAGIMLDDELRFRKGLFAGIKIK